MQRAVSLFIFLVVITTVVGVFCYVVPDSSEDKEIYSVSIAVSKTPLSTPFYVAKFIKAFEDTCVKVEYNEVIGGLVAFNKVIDGENDFATSSDSVIAFKSLTQESFSTHAMFVQSDNDVKLLTNKAGGIHSVPQLKEKRIGVTKGSASEYFLSTLLAIEGLSVEDVTLYDYKPAELIKGLANNEVDAIVPWEPFAFNAINQRPEEIDIQETKNINTLSFNLVSKKADDLLVKKAECIIEGLNVAIAYIASHPENAKNIVIEELGLDPSFIDWVWHDYVFKLGLNQSLIFNIKSQAAWAIDMQMSEVNEMPNIEELIDSRAMVQVDPGAVNIPL